jgi:hypothetical protein
MTASEKERRRHRRSGIRVPVSLSYANATIETSTLNMSATGMRLKRPGRLFIPPGEAIDVSFQGTDQPALTAQVAHLGKSHIGLQLDGKRFSGE